VIVDSPLFGSKALFFTPELINTIIRGREPGRIRDIYFDAAVKFVSLVSRKISGPLDIDSD